MSLILCKTILKAGLIRVEHGNNIMNLENDENATSKMFVNFLNNLSYLFVYHKRIYKYIDSIIIYYFYYYFWLSCRVPVFDLKIRGCHIYRRPTMMYVDVLYVDVYEFTRTNLDIT